MDTILIPIHVNRGEFLAIVRSLQARLRELADSEDKAASREEDEILSLEKKLLTMRAKAGALITS